MAVEENWKNMQRAFEHQLSAYEGEIKVSKYSSSSFAIDPSHWLFRLARYKHCSRLLEGSSNVLEIGSGDCLFSTMVAKKVENLLCIEEHPDLCKYAAENIPTIFNNIEICNLSFPDDLEKISSTKCNKPQEFDGIFCLDVFEHIPPSKSNDFLNGVKKLLSNHGVYIAGIPSLEAQQYASPGSKVGHVNCMSKDTYKQFLKNHFHNVFIFSINDETLHTGFGPMSQYLLALCTTPKSTIN